ncbi:MAG TPA: hypothetical protein PL143_14835, partial [Rhodocyclaceae bacterium]|nr:hypothetical protein [Rhodocyclaceae bacterium]
MARQAAHALAATFIHRHKETPTMPTLTPTPVAATRIEHDLLGDLAVPADAYYGVQTARALDNFRITD